MKAGQTISYDINTQRDFIPHDGKFHLEGAEKLVGVGPKLHIVTDAVAIIGTESPAFHA